MIPSLLTRRQLLTRGSQALATSAFVSAATHAHAQGSDKIKIALVGCGGRGTGAASQALNACVGLQRRYQPSYMETIKRVRDGAIGDVQFMRVYWNGQARAGLERNEGESELAYQIRNWYFFTWLSGDHILEQHVHNLDVA